MEGLLHFFQFFQQVSGHTMGLRDLRFQNEPVLNACKMRLE